MLLSCNRHKQYHIETQTIVIDSLHQIHSIDDSLVKPMLYTNVRGLHTLPTPEAKQKFIAAVLPSILVARHRIEDNKRTLLHLLHDKKKWEEKDSIFVNDLLTKYRASDTDDLINRIVTIPTSIVLAQAAIESGWGQSRFFLEGSNLFGVWSFNKDEPRMEAKQTRNDKRVYLRAYTDMSGSIEHYFEILGRGRLYANLRHAINQDHVSDPFELLPHFLHYSEKRNAYISQLKKMIVANNLTQYDQHKIDPTYIKPLP
jgi:Bax protein